jgi:hypothetical protein
MAEEIVASNADNCPSTVRQFREFMWGVRPGLYALNYEMSAGPEVGRKHIIHIVPNRCRQAAD